jgi:hypothetical protein
MHVEVDGGLKLVNLERREERGAHGVEEHRGLEGSEDVAGGIGEVLGAQERELDRPVLDVCIDQFQAQRGGRARQWRPPLRRVPERS